MESWIYTAAFVAIFLVAFSMGVVASDFFSTRYWNGEIRRINKMHQSAITSVTVASFNEGVLATRASADDGDGKKEIVND